ncbi:hypothetical protein NPS52_09440 [Pseudomonas putida]|uniref:hypothetical protein n=1 Tax=Pseudomonas putida TaxID=303 RepID=UPI002364586B|nr:hypothetical protein [Pseudomonas putida]MDD2150858.1 hypothetical protein [Pseudomonas putida]
MSTRAELIVAVIDKTAKPVNNAGAAAAIHDQFNSDKTGFSLVIQAAQTTTAIASVISITHFAVGAVPFINIVTNTLSGTVTFLKIAADFKEGAEIKRGDVISLAGNVQCCRHRSLLRHSGRSTIHCWRGHSLRHKRYSLQHRQFRLG